MCWERAGAQWRLGGSKMRKGNVIAPCYARILLRHHAEEQHHFSVQRVQRGSGLHSSKIGEGGNTSKIAI